MYIVVRMIRCSARSFQSHGTGPNNYPKFLYLGNLQRTVINVLAVKLPSIDIHVDVARVQQCHLRRMDAHYVDPDSRRVRPLHLAENHDERGGHPHFSWTRSNTNDDTTLVSFNRNVALKEAVCLSVFSYVSMVASSAPRIPLSYFPAWTRVS